MRSRSLGLCVPAGLWVFLIRRQPQYADPCDWSKLEGGHWAKLLRAQPQFAKKRKK